MKKSILKSIYKFDEKKQRYVIDVSLNYYQELFNDWDGSPVRKKDLDPELIDYLETSSYDIPKRHKILISFTLPLDQKNLEREKKAKSGINNYCKSILYFTKKELNYNLRKIMLFITLGFFFILIAYVVQNLSYINLGFDVLLEGVFIGGWVLLWEAFSLFFFSMYEVRRKKAMYQRFLDSEFVFKYK